MKNPMNLAVELAKEAGAVQLESLGKIHNIEQKGSIDIVTDVDKRCEDLIVERIKKEFSNHYILAEEGSGQVRDSEWKWIIDPLDGTVNYAHSFPFFGPSIAIEKNGELVFAVVYIPSKDELFIAEKASGAELNGQKISVSRCDKLISSLLATGFAYSVMEGELKDNLKHFAGFTQKTQAVRRNGMAEGDLCYVACGRLDGFWELHLKAWDIAAGTLMIREAGGCVTNFDDTPVDIYGKEIVASNGLIHDSILEILNGGTHA